MTDLEVPITKKDLARTMALTISANMIVGYAVIASLDGKLSFELILLGGSIIFLILDSAVARDGIWRGVINALFKPLGKSI